MSGLSVDCHENKDNKGRGGSVMAPFPPPILRLALSRFLHIFALNRKEKKETLFSSTGNVLKEYLTQRKWAYVNIENMLCNYLKN